MATTHTPHGRRTRDAWATGLMVFGATLLTIAGILDILRGIMAIAEDDVFVSTADYVFQFDLTGWGWIHLALGVIAVVIGFGMFQGATWARIGGVAVAGLIIVANFLSLPYYPVWSVVMIAMSAFIIWALCVARSDSYDDPFARG
ncbi:DUF7144 family membrane protein [Streptomyces sp. NPDC001595]|uniref:DUF7144 family membrane protein n=1 Tax=Streptomyces sp. NPDC001532 TaxID=3154520 RepID=UPI003328150E